MVKEILKLGDPGLHEICEPVFEKDLPQAQEWICDLHDTLMDFRQKYGAGRAIAAPQIGIKKRLIYMYVDNIPYVIMNPKLTFPDDEKYTLIDDCMSFPGLCVKVERYRRAVVKFLDEDFIAQMMELEGDMAELVQHEYDHLDGILATMRAVDENSLIKMQMKRDF